MATLYYFLLIKLVRFFHYIHADFIGNWIGNTTGLNPLLEALAELPK